VSKRRKPYHGDPRKGAIVPQARDSDGYATVILEGPDGPAVERVCDLVLRAFRGPCPEGHRAEHINGDVTDDRLVNLRYVAIG
jgi:hypothetical protein